jgi:hypothetical protein
MARRAGRVRGGTSRRSQDLDCDAARRALALSSTQPSAPLATDPAKIQTFATSTVAGSVTTRQPAARGLR